MEIVPNVREISFALIGCGVNGTKQHAKLLGEIQGARLAAVCDTDETKAREMGKRYGVEFFTDYREMLRRPDIDIVTVSVPSGLHAEVAIACAEAGKHALVEKPMDITLEKADAMIAAFRKADRKLSIVSQHRFDPATVQVKRDVEQGRFGRLILGTAAVNWYRSQDYYDSGDWRGTWALDGGGALMNQSIHTIDLLQYIFGPVTEVHALCVTMGHERIEVEDAAVSTVKFASGAIGTIVGTTCAYPGLKTRLEVFGEKGSAVIEKDKLVHSAFMDQEELIAEVAAADTGTATVTDASAARTRLSDSTAAAANRIKPGSLTGTADGLTGTSATADAQQSVNLPVGVVGQAEPSEADGAARPDAIAVKAHRLQIEDMIEAVRTGRDPAITGEEGRKALEIILAIYRSQRIGLPVKLPLTAE